MNDKTLAALTALANKLGTTAEYLWGVLLRQAPISGVIGLLLTIGWLVLVVLLFRFVRQKTAYPTGEPKETNRYGQPEWGNEAAFFAWLSVVLVVVIGAFIVLMTLSTTVAALVNPEYWALRQILR